MRAFEIALDREQKPDPIAQLETPSLPMQIHILHHIQFYTTRVTETHVTTLISKGY